MNDLETRLRAELSEIAAGVTVVESENLQSRRTTPKYVVGVSALLVVALAVGVAWVRHDSSDRVTSAVRVPAAVASDAGNPVEVAPGVTLESVPDGASARRLSNGRESYASEGMTTVEVALADGGQVRVVVQKTADAEGDLKAYQKNFGGTPETLNGSPAVSGFSMSPGWQTIAWAPSATVQVALHYTIDDVIAANEIANGVRIDEEKLS